MSKQEQYEQFIPELSLLTQDEHNEISVLANVSAAIKEEFGFFWVGFYLVDKADKNHLSLGPFQGSPACYRIPFGKGVCGHAWKEQKTVVVPDVEQFEGHIACSSLSRSEIVVPVFDKKQNIVGVLDIDSTELSTFDDTDQVYLEKVCELITDLIY